MLTHYKKTIVKNAQKRAYKKLHSKIKLFINNNYIKGSPKVMFDQLFEIKELCSFIDFCTKIINKKYRNHQYLEIDWLKFNVMMKKVVDKNDK